MGSAHGKRGVTVVISISLDYMCVCLSVRMGSAHGKRGVKVNNICLCMSVCEVSGKASSLLMESVHEMRGTKTAIGKT